MNCTACGSPLQPGFAFCTNCGARVQHSHHAAPSASPPSILHFYTTYSSRPLGIVALIVLTVFLAIALLGAAGFAASTTILQGAIAMPFDGEGPSPWRLLIAYLYYLLAALSLASSYGLYAFEPWAPRLAQILWLLAGIFFLVIMFRSSTAVLMGLAGLATVAWAVYYLQTPHVQDLYSHGGGSRHA